MVPAYSASRAGTIPKASRDRSLGTLAKQMKILIFALSFFAFTAISLGDSEISLTLDHVVGRDGYRFSISPSSERIMLCMQTSVAMKEVPMKSTDTYFSNQIPTGPNMLRPLCIIQLFDREGSPIGKSRFRDRSLLNTRLESAATALILQPGDRFALHDGVYPEKPLKAEIRIVIYEGAGWVEKTLYWKNES